MRRKGGIWNLFDTTFLSDRVVFPRAFSLLDFEKSEGKGGLTYRKVAYGVVQPHGPSSSNCSDSISLGHCVQP
jgi:hypothetical protein